MAYLLSSTLPTEEDLIDQLFKRETAPKRRGLWPSFPDPEARRMMHEIAECYERLAQRLEQHARDADDG
jgi:hypothetical protein